MSTVAVLRPVDSVAALFPVGSWAPLFPTPPAPMAVVIDGEAVDGGRIGHAPHGTLIAVIFELPSLPYTETALQPYMSAKTLRMHHDVLQKRYVKKLNELARGPWSQLPLEQLILEAPESPLLDNAQQVFNHTFFWHSMKRNGGGKPSPRTGFGQAFSVAGNRFRQMFLDAATQLFGSGYIWVVADPQGELLIFPGSNAENPMRYGFRPMLTMDLWEHAYLLDHGPYKDRYASDFLNHLVNWQFAEANYARAFGA
jgi:Fe-Mn family superoxide dismutase